MRRTPVLILGGGPAGSSAAITLARGGATPLLLERTAEPTDPLCGGFLSWRTLDALANCGVEADDLNRRRVRRVRLYAGKLHAEAALPGPAVGVSRRRLDSLLLSRAAAAGAKVERGVMVRDIAGDTARLGDGATITADAMLLATGKHDLRGILRPHRSADPTLGLRVRLAPSPALERLVGDAIELHMFAGGYAGIVVQEDGSANLCMAIRRSRLRAVKDAAALLAQLANESPPLGDRLAHAASEAVIDAVANVPYGWRALTTETGRYRLGDQAAVIPSLAGEGMGIAIASGVSAGRGILHGEDAPEWQARFARDTARPIAIAARIWAAAERPRAAAALVAFARTPGLVRRAARLTRIKQPGVDGATPPPHS